MQYQTMGVAYSRCPPSSLSCPHTFPVTLPRIKLHAHHLKHPAKLGRLPTALLLHGPGTGLG